jgi:hypothetical protein
MVVEMNTSIAPPKTTTGQLPTVALIAIVMSEISFTEKGGCPPGRSLIRNGPISTGAQFRSQVSFDELRLGIFELDSPNAGVRIVIAHPLRIGKGTSRYEQAIHMRVAIGTVP